MSTIPIILDKAAWITVADACMAERARLRRKPEPARDDQIAVTALFDVNLAARPVFLREPSRASARLCLASDVVALIVRVLRNAGRGQTADRVEEQVPRKKRRAA